MNFNNLILLQIETVGPEGGKAILLFIVFILILASIVYFLLKSIPLKKKEFNSKIEISIKGNSPISFSNLKIIIRNTGNQTATIEQPLLHFSNILKSKSYRIKSVKPAISFPITIHPDEEKTLDVSLEPFYNFNSELNNFFLIDVEISYDQHKKAKKQQVGSTIKIEIKS